MQSNGKYLIVFGIIAIVAGLILSLFGNKMNWFGNLPGDIKIEKENFRIYIPLTTMLLLSIIISLLLWVVRKMF